MKKQRAKKPETVTKRGSGGSDFERMVRGALRQLEDEGLCKVWKVPTDLRLTTGGKLARGEPMPSDFIGFTASGRSILIECKDVVQPRLKLGGSPGLTPHQVQALRLAVRARALYLVLWKNRDRITILTTGEAPEALIALLRERSVKWRPECSIPVSELLVALHRQMILGCETDAPDSSRWRLCFSSPAVPPSTP